MASLGGLRAGLECREIRDEDLPGVVDCLMLCFPSRRRAFWERGLAKLALHTPLEGFPRYGFLLADAGRVVGVVLAVYLRPGGEGPVRCNMSSWCVAPDYAGYANRLVFAAFRDRSATFVNTSPIAKTWRVAEGFGMKRFCEGQMLFVPALTAPPPGAHVIDYEASRAAGLTDYEKRLMTEHEALGCRSLLCIDRDGVAHPFVFLRRRILREMLPVRQLIYCRDVSDLSRFAGAIGRYMLREKAILFVADAIGPIPGLVGRFFQDSGPKYCRGPNPPRLGDLSYTELVFFDT